MNRGGRTGQNTLSHAEFQPLSHAEFQPFGGREGFLRAPRPDINGH